MNRGGVQREQLIGVVLLAAITEVVIHSDESELLQLLDGTACGAVGDAAGFGDGLPAGIAAVHLVVAAKQVAVDGKDYGRQLIIKNPPWQYDKGFSLHFSVLLLALKKVLLLLSRFEG